MFLSKKAFASFVSMAVIVSSLSLSAGSASATSPSAEPIKFSKEAPNYVATINCGAANGESFEIPSTVRGSLTVQMTNCTGKKLDTGAAGIVVGSTPQIGVVLSPIPASFKVNSGASLVFQSSDGSSEFTLDYLSPRAIRPNPDGPLAASTNMVIGSKPKTFTVTENNSNGGYPVHDLGTDPDCRIEVGEHVYTTKKFKISSAGSFTFRFVKTNNVDRRQFFWGTQSKISDPFLAVYQDFDPTQMDSNVIGCNDDSGTTEESVSGQLLHSRYSQFTTRLQPGNYTLILATFGVAPANTWTAPAGGTFELWGNGLQLADAATGTKVSGFGVNQWRLNNRVINGIDKLLTSPKTITAVTCTGTTQNSKVSDSGRSLAKARAIMSCLHIKTKYPKIKTTIAANPATGMTAGDRAVILEITR